MNSNVSPNGAGGDLVQRIQERYSALRKSERIVADYLALPARASEVRWGAAIAFYLIYIAGMVWFAIKPGIVSGQVGTAVLNGALLGALCYATFDLTSQAVLKVWSTQISVMDIAWGAFATAVASGVACWATLRFAS